MLRVKMNNVLLICPSVNFILLIIAQDLFFTSFERTASSASGWKVKALMYVVACNTHDSTYARE